MFKAFKGFSHTHKIAKQFLRKTLKVADIRQKKTAFNSWKKENDVDKQEDGKVRQNLLVEEVQEVFESSGNLQTRKARLA